MSIPILSSTLLLVLLLLVGLFFFIRASVKDRTQVARFASDQSRESLIGQLQQYFVKRAYRIAAVNAEEEYVELEGIVRPSLFLAIFLMLLTAIGILCLALVLSVLLLSSSWVEFLPVLLSPIASIFYWRKAKRLETVVIKVEPVKDDVTSTHRSVVTVTAHRDELLELQRSLLLESAE